MEFIINKNLLLENLLNVSKAISSKNLIPVLAGINFNLTNKGLSLTACDNEIMINAFIDKKEIKDIKNEGNIIISGKYIVEYIRKLTSQEIHFTVLDGTKVLIKTNHSELTINGMDSADFPKWELEKTKNSFELKVNQYKEIITQTLFAAGISETRPIFTGVNFTSEKGLLSCVATDSYRLAKYKMNLENDIDMNIVIPSKSLSEFNKLLTDTKQKIINIQVYASKIVFVYENIIFQSKLLSGTYPNTSQLIPNNYELIFEIMTNEFYQIIDRVSLLNMDKEKNTVNLFIKDNIATLTSTSPELGKAVEQIEITKNNNIDFEISFSSKFMLEALRTIKSEKTIIKLNDRLKPIIIEATDNNHALQLIVPIITY